jgi:hypothetical protein
MSWPNHFPTAGDPMQRDVAQRGFVSEAPQHADVGLGGGDQARPVAAGLDELGGAVVREDPTGSQRRQRPQPLEVRVEFIRLGDVGDGVRLVEPAPRGRPAAGVLLRATLSHDVGAGVTANVGCRGDGRLRRVSSMAPVETVEDLYGLPLERFVSERTALVKALRAERQRDRANAVAKARKPSVAAWAVNQLVRTQAASIRTLFAAGDDLAQAQAGAAAGQRTAAAMRTASSVQREALDELLDAAKGLLSGDGHPLTAATLERVTDTLRAASIDEASRAEVQDGRLTQEIRFAGLGMGALAAAAPPDPHDPAPKKPKADHGQALEAQRQAEAQAAAVRERKRKRERAMIKAAQKAEGEARRAATRAAKELTAAQAQRDQVAAALQEADELLTGATERAGRAAAALRDAEAAATRLAED